MLLTALVTVALIAGCGGTESVGAAEGELPADVQAAIDRYVDAVNAQDAEALYEAVNPAVFERVWGGNSYDIEYLMARMDAFRDRVLVAEHLDQISVRKNVATENTYYVAVTAQMTSDDENVPVSGIIVLTVTEYPDRGWLITMEDQTGM